MQSSQWSIGCCTPHGLKMFWSGGIRQQVYFSWRRVTWKMQNVCLYIYIYLYMYIFIYIFVYLLASFFGSPCSKLEVRYPLLSSLFFEVDLGDHYAPRFVATTALGSSYTVLKRSVPKNFELLCFKGNVDVMLIYPVARASS